MHLQYLDDLEPMAHQPRIPVFRVRRHAVFTHVGAPPGNHPQHAHGLERADGFSQRRATDREHVHELPLGGQLRTRRQFPLTDERDDLFYRVVRQPFRPHRVEHLRYSGISPQGTPP